MCLLNNDSLRGYQLPDYVKMTTPDPTNELDRRDAFLCCTICHTTPKEGFLNIWDHLRSTKHKKNSQAVNSALVKQAEHPLSEKLFFSVPILPYNSGTFDPFTAFASNFPASIMYKDVEERRLTGELANLTQAELSSGLRRYRCAEKLQR